MLRRQNGCDDIPVVAGLIGGDSGGATPFLASHLPCASAGTVALWRVRQHSCRRGFSRRGQWWCDAQTGATTFLSSRVFSAGTACCDAQTGATTFLSSRVFLSGTAVLQRPNGCDDIPVVAGFLDGDSGAATPRKASHLPTRQQGQWCYGGCDDIPVVAGFLGRDGVLRRHEWRRTCAARRRDADATLGGVASASR